jgi:hypothetical protein
MTVIDNGLQAGEEVVIDGQMRVVPGGKVEVKRPDKPGTARITAPGSGSAKDQSVTSGR